MAELLKDSDVLRVAKAIWQHEIDNNEHNEPFILSWYEEPARVAIRAYLEPEQ